jgi:hypothetical protein
LLHDRHTVKLVATEAWALEVYIIHTHTHTHTHTYTHLHRI